MCRVLAYLGPPLNVENVLFTTDSSLARQAYSPRMMASFLNLAGFGMVAWDPDSRTPEAPFVYRTTTLPAFDRNLENLARKIAPQCFLAHIRGASNSPEEVISERNVHPFLYGGAHVALAHNGILRDFGRMRYGLLEFIKPELAHASRPDQRGAAPRPNQRGVLRRLRVRTRCGSKDKRQTT